MKDWKEMTQMGLLVVIAATVIYGTFIKKEKTRILRGPGSMENSSAVIPPPSNNNQNLSVGIDPSKKEGSSSTFASTQLAWAEEVHSFGTIKQHTENVHVFKFQNVGENPLIIEDAQGSCGCTVPEYPREPIAPGESGEITVKYSPGTQMGQQQKTVAITANTEPRVFNLTINANVEEAPEPVLNE